jgi:hypothetical protein
MKHSKTSLFKNDGNEAFNAYSILKSNANEALSEE